MLPPDRRPEGERQRHRPDEGERVPVGERLAQAGDPLAVRHEVRDHLAQERPEQHRTEEREQTQRNRAHRPRRNGSDQHAEQREREVDDPAVEVLPRTVRLERPHDREPVPEDEPAEQREERDPEAVQLRKRQDAQQHERHADRCREDREPADPDERRVGRPVAEEERERHQRAGCADQGPGGAWEAQRHRGRS